MVDCLCGNTKSYVDCCGRFLEEGKFAETPEELMRSRFTAYATGNIDYIIRTTTKAKRKELSKEELENWAKNLHWISLEVVKAQEPREGEDKATVEFVAKYAYGDLEHRHHEISTFLKFSGRWFFDDAKFLDEK